MKKKTRDVILAILSAAGINYFIRSIWILVLPALDYLSVFFTDTFVDYTYLVIDLIVYLVLAIIVWKNVKLTKRFTKYFKISVIAIILFELIGRIIIITI